jgi:hypothetical protein
MKRVKMMTYKCDTERCKNKITTPVNVRVPPSSCPTCRKKGQFAFSMGFRKT